MRDSRHVSGGLFRVFGLYLLYAVVGGFILALTVTGILIDPPDEEKSPTRWTTKLVAAGSGLGFFAVWLSTLAHDPGTNQTGLRIVALAGGIGGVALMLWSWALIARDLGRQRPEPTPHGARR